MNCPSARDWLLQTERPSRLEDAPPEVAGHVGGCLACQRLAHGLDDLERRYRDELAPATAEQARDSFRPRLYEATPLVLPRVGRRGPPRWFLAASVLLAVSATVWMLLPTPQAQAADVVERLIDWNLQLTQSRTPEERNRIYAEQAPQLKAALQQAELRPSDRQLGDTLLESGSWLTANADPMAEADRFNDLAEQLMVQLDRATNKKDAQAHQPAGGLLLPGGPARHPGQRRTSRAVRGPELPQAEEAGARHHQ